MSKLAHDWDKYETLANHSSDDICKNCIYRVEEHSWSINSNAKPEKIRQLCTRRGTFNEVCEVCLTGFCKYFTPSNPPKDDKLEVVYHGHTVVLSNTADGIRVEIKEKNDE